MCNRQNHEIAMQDSFYVPKLPQIVLVALGNMMGRCPRGSDIAVHIAIGKECDPQNLESVGYDLVVQALFHSSARNSVWSNRCARNCTEISILGTLGVDAR